MYLMYYTDDAGVRVYTMEVRLYHKPSMHASAHSSTSTHILHRVTESPPTPSPPPPGGPRPSGSRPGFP